MYLVYDAWLASPTYFKCGEKPRGCICTVTDLSFMWDGIIIVLDAEGVERSCHTNQLIKMEE